MFMKYLNIDSLYFNSRSTIYPNDIKAHFFSQCVLIGLNIKLVYILFLNI